MEYRERGSGRLGGYTERDFKVCDLCGALNPVTNCECFVCGWNGRFDHDRETVIEAIRTLEIEHGDLTPSLFEEEIVPSRPPRTGQRSSIWDAVRKLFSRAQRRGR